MAVLSFREVLPRTLQHRFGESPTAEMKFVATLDGPTPTQQIINAVGYGHGSPHPEYGYLSMLDATLTETDRFHAEISLRFEAPTQQTPDPNPLARPDVWSFSTGGAQVPALIYYSGTGNGSKKSLVNSAEDFFEGLTTYEAEVRATIAGNREEFPADVAAAVTNSINNSPYLWGPKHTWLCTGISAQQATEIVNDEEVRYWQITTELVFRASTHNLQLPNVGWSYIKNGQKKRVWVKDEEDEKVPAASPRPLEPSGDLRQSGDPDILIRRIYPEINFRTYFGAPPF